jgi:hypothetical protein
MIFQGNDDISIQYADIPKLPGVIKVNNNKRTYAKFTRPGRNPDFNYWYNCNSANLSDAAAYIKIRFIRNFVQPGLDGPLQNLGYYIHLKFHLKFSNFIILEHNKQSSNVESFQNIKKIDGEQESAIFSDEKLESQKGKDSNEEPLDRLSGH